MKKTTILIADDHEVVRTGLAAIFGYQKDLQVVGQAENGEETVRLVRKLSPDVVVMDLMMPVMDGLTATREIVAKNPSSHVIILTTFASAAEIRQALEAGASGAISKDRPNAELVAAIRKVTAGERAISADIENQLAADAEVPSLTDRQLDVLESLTRGLTNHDIAIRFGISEDGVKAHMRAIFAKLNVSNRSEAAAYALKRNLVRP